MAPEVNVSLPFCCCLDISPQMALFNILLLKLSIMYATLCKEISRTHTLGQTSKTSHFLHLCYSHHNINKHLPQKTLQQPSDWSLSLKNGNQTIAHPYLRSFNDCPLQLQQKSRIYLALQKLLEVTPALLQPHQNFILHAPFAWSALAPNIHMPGFLPHYSDSPEMLSSQREPPS